MHSGGSNLHGVIFFNWCVLLQVFIPSVKVLEGGWRGSLRRRFWFFQAVRAVLWEGVCQHLLDPKWNWISAIEEQACDAAKFWATIGSRLLFSSTLSLPLLFFFLIAVGEVRFGVLELQRECFFVLSIVFLGGSWFCFRLEHCDGVAILSCFYVCGKEL